jgi:hypothetical protein
MLVCQKIQAQGTIIYSSKHRRVWFIVLLQSINKGFDGSHFANGRLNPILSEFLLKRL